MAVLRTVCLVILFFSDITNWQVEATDESRSFSINHDKVLLRQKRAIDPLSLIGLVVSVGATIQGAVCSFTDVCSTDKITPMLEEMQAKLDDIHDDVISIKKDVKDIWEESKRKWYFNHIAYTVKQREKVIKNIKNNDNSARAQQIQERFINEVFGGEGNDEYIEKALFHIPKLIIEEGLVTRYYKVQTDNGKSTIDAVKLTWKFIKKLFRFQEDGYTSLVLAASLKYKNDLESFNKTMSEVCTWWPKSSDPVYSDKFCSKFVKDPASQNRRKPQQDFLFAIRDFSLYPVQVVQTDCSKFTDSDYVVYSTGYLYIAQPVAKKILIVNPETLSIVKTINVPGSECGGNCHPFGIAIHVEYNLLAIAAQSKLSAGESKVMLFKIKGNLKEPSRISIEHYYTIPQLMNPRFKKADVRDVAFCGQRFAYADYNGAIWNYRLPDELYYGWNDGKPKPNYGDRIDWALNIRYNDYKGHLNYLGCSNDGKYFVIEKNSNRDGWDDGYSDNGVGAVRSNFAGGSSNVLDVADIKVIASDFNDIMDGRIRLNQLMGIAMDSKGNLFYSSGEYYAHSVSGVYQRTSDGKRRYLREWNPKSKVKMFGMAVDENGFMYSVQKKGSGNKCLHKFHHEIDLEDININ